MRNKYGLSRYIPPNVKREVRKRCGFGCVVCGVSIIEYEHIDPPFAEAKEHDPDKIALLCPQHHSKVTRQFLSKQTVKKALEDPFCKKSGYANEMFDIGQTHPKIIFAGQTLTNCQIPIEVKGMPLFEIKEPEEIGGPFRLSGCFYNSCGQLSLQIIDNEWRTYETNWDVEATGGKIIIRDAPQHISLKMVTTPPDGVIVEELDMYLEGYRFLGSPDKLAVTFQSGGWNTLTGCIADHCRVGFGFA
jgi:hypothetical protein